MQGTSIKKGACLALSVLALACGDASEPSEDHEVHSILGGQLEHGQPSVGLVGSLETGGTICTATLIAPGWIVTASHCKALHGFYTGTDASNFKFRALGDRVYRYTESGSDVALIRLREPIHDISFTERSSTLPGNGDECEAVGFGEAANAPDSKLGIKRSGKQRVVSANEAEILVEGAAPLQGGDSGGPLLCAGKIVGVASTGNGKYMTLDNAWVSRVLANPQAAPSQPRREPAFPPPVPAVKLLGYTGALCPAGSLSIEDGVVSGQPSKAALKNATQTCTMRLSISVPAGKMFDSAAFYPSFLTNKREIAGTARFSVPGINPDSVGFVVKPTSTAQNMIPKIGPSECRDPLSPTVVPLTVELAVPLRRGDTFSFGSFDASLAAARGTKWWNCSVQADAEKP